MTRAVTLDYPTRPAARWVRPRVWVDKLVRRRGTAPASGEVRRLRLELRETQRAWLESLGSSGRCSPEEDARWRAYRRASGRYWAARGGVDLDLGECDR